MPHSATLRAKVTVHPSLDAGKELARIARTVTGWGRADGYRIHCDYSTSGQVRDLRVHVTLTRDFPQPHHAIGGVSDALSGLSSSRARIVVR